MGYSDPEAIAQMQKADGWRARAEAPRPAGGHPDAPPPRALQPAAHFPGSAPGPKLPGLGGGFPGKKKVEPILPPEPEGKARTESGTQRQPSV